MSKECEEILKGLSEEPCTKRYTVISTMCDTCKIRQAFFWTKPY